MRPRAAALRAGRPWWSRGGASTLQVTFYRDRRHLRLPARLQRITDPHHQLQRKRTTGGQAAGQTLVTFTMQQQPRLDQRMVTAQLRGPPGERPPGQAGHTVPLRFPTVPSFLFPHPRGHIPSYQTCSPPPGQDNQLHSRYYHTARAPEAPSRTDQEERGLAILFSSPRIQLSHPRLRLVAAFLLLFSSFFQLSTGQKPWCPHSLSPTAHI